MLAHVLAELGRFSVRESGHKGDGDDLKREAGSAGHGCARPFGLTGNVF